MGCTHARTCIVGGDGDLSLNYEIGVLIGEGSFGKVWEVTNRETRQVGAAKVIKIPRSSKGMKVLHVAWEEERVWRRVGKHENIVQLCSVFGDNRTVCLVMERCQQSLLDVMPSMIGTGGSGVRGSFKQMLRAVAHVHRRRVVHRDIKPDNFLLGGPSGKIIKLCDFGMASVELRDGELLGGTFGTTPYMSPEIVGSVGHDRSTDIWSFGVVAYVMIYGDFPYMPERRSNQEIKYAILYGAPIPTYKPVWSGLPRPLDVAEDFVRSMLQREPLDRRTADELLRCPFLKGAAELERKSVKQSISGSSLGSRQDSDPVLYASTDTGDTRGTANHRSLSSAFSMSLDSWARTFTGFSQYARP